MAAYKILEVKEAENGLYKVLLRDIDTQEISTITVEDPKDFKEQLENWGGVIEINPVE